MIRTRTGKICIEIHETLSVLVEGWLSDLRQFSVGFEWNYANFFSLALKKIRRAQVSQMCRLKRRSSRFLRHIIVVSYLPRLVVFFCPQNGLYLLDFDFQVGLIIPRVYPGVSGWVCKLWYFNPNKWSIKDLIPEKSPAKKYSKEWQSTC